MSAELVGWKFDLTAKGENVSQSDSTAGSSEVTAAASDVRSGPDGVRLTLREQSRRERYARIMEAADILFQSKGYNEVTTREVARQAGVGEATLFRYVANKEELLLLVMGEKVEQLLDGIERQDDEKARISTPSDRGRGAWYVDRVLAIYYARVNFFISDPDNVSTYLSYGLRTDSSIGRRSMAHGDRVISRAARILGSAQDAGVIRGDIDATVVALNCNGLWIHEVLRLPARGFGIAGTWERLQARLLAQLKPLVLDGTIE